MRASRCAAAALLLALLLCGGSAQAFRRGMLQAPGGNSMFPLFGRAQLTAEQATSMVGVWALQSPDDHRRLDGSLMDGVVIEALQNRDLASGMDEMAGEAIKDSSSLLDYKLVIPSVDAESGLFTAYRLINNSTSSGPGAFQKGQAFIDVKRIVGMAYAGPEGEVYWQGVENVDTSTYQGYLPPGEGWMEILRMEGEEVWTEDGTRTLDDQSVLQMRLYREDAEEVLATAVESLQDKMPLVVIKAGQSYVS